MQKAKLAVAAACLLLGATVAANASPYTVTLKQVGSNVVATGDGNIDTSGLSGDGVGPGGSAVEANVAYLILGGGPVWVYDTQSFTGPTSFGPGSNFTSANSQLGASAGIYIAGGFEVVIYVPSGYVSDSNISDSATWNNTTLVSLGITPGAYMWSWGAGGTDQSFTLDVVSPTPLPAALPLFASGLGALGLAAWRRRKKAA